MLRLLATGGHLNRCQDNTELLGTVAAELANFSNLYKFIQRSKPRNAGSSKYTYSAHGAFANSSKIQLAHTVF